MSIVYRLLKCSKLKIAAEMHRIKLYYKYKIGDASNIHIRIKMFRTLSLAPRVSIITHVQSVNDN